MSLYAPSDETHQPVLWIHGRAVYAAHFVVAVFVLSMVTTSISMAMHATVLPRWLPYFSADVLSGQVWRIGTYGLWNPPSIAFAIDMLMIAWFGREVEKFLGRRLFLLLFATVYLVSPLLFTALGPWWTTMFAGETGALAIFVAFAALYPGALLMFEIQARWAAIIIVAIYFLMGVAYNNWVGLLSLCASVGAALSFIRFQQGVFVLPRFLRFERRPKLRVLPDLEEEKRPPPRSEAGEAMAEVDRLLDKIAASGLGSLTAKERARLEAARAKMKQARRDSE